MSPLIRDFESGDYPGLAAVRNSIYYHFPRTVDELRFEDDCRERQCLHRRWLAELPDAGVVAAGAYSQNPFAYHPRKFSINVMVKPEHQRQGLGAALYATVMTALAPLDPISVRMFTREDKPGAAPFLFARGFVEQERNWESRLDLTTFDFTPYAGVDEKARARCANQDDG